MHPLLKLFCNNSSLRGVGKIVRYKGALRIIWVSYVMGMLFLMLYAVAMLIKEYNSSVTSLMTRVIFDIPLEFPAITICYYKPFSWRAESIWRSRNVTTPDEFNRNIRETSLYFLNSNRHQIAKQIFDYDQIRLYYQNFKVEEADQVSYTEDDMFLFCVVRYTKSQYRKGSLDHCKLKVTKISMAEYFNCFTVQAIDETISRQMVSLTLVLKFNTSAASNYTERAFIQNVFEQTNGARIQIHEPNALPKMNAADTISISKGTLAEINYWVSQTEEESGKKDKCSPSSELIGDMDKQYRYSHDACVEREMNKFYIKNCKCMMATPPRPQLPDDEVRYCGRIDFKHLGDFIRRVKCLTKLQQNTNDGIGALKMKQLIRSHICSRPCSELKYGIHLSTSKWSPDLLKMEQAMRLTNSWDAIREASYSKEQKMQASRDILNYLNEDFDNNDDSFRDDQSTANIRNGEESPFSCIRLHRINFDMIHSKDNLILSFNGFISRLGGLCSLTLGLTCIFFIEIIEYAYLAFNALTHNKEKPAEIQSKPKIENSHESNDLIQSSNLVESETLELKEAFV